MMNMPPPRDAIAAAASDRAASTGCESGWVARSRVVREHHQRRQIAHSRIMAGTVRAATGWHPNEYASTGESEIRHRQAFVWIRDYGMFDRREAPQYYPDIPPTGSAPEPPATYYGLESISKQPCGEAMPRAQDGPRCAGGQRRHSRATQGLSVPCPLRPKCTADRR